MLKLNFTQIREVHRYSRISQTSGRQVSITMLINSAGPSSIGQTALKSSRFSTESFIEMEHDDSPEEHLSLTLSRCIPYACVCAASVFYTPYLFTRASTTRNACFRRLFTLRTVSPFTHKSRSFPHI